MYIYVYIHTYRHNSSMCMVQAGWASLKEWMRHVAHMNESCRTCDCERHDSFMCATWLIHVSDMTHSCERHDSFMCATWLIHECDISQGRELVFKSLWVMSHIWMSHVTHVIVSDMTQSRVRHDSFMCATWLIYVCDMTHSCKRHDSFMCATWLIHVCDVTHSCVWRDSFMCAP